MITYPTSTFLGGSGARGGGSGSGIWLFSTWSNSGFNLSSSQVAELLALSLRESPAMEDTVRNEDRSVNRDLLLSAQLSVHHKGSLQRLDYSRYCTNLPADLPVHSSLTHEQDLKVLELLHSGQDLLTGWFQNPCYVSR